MMNARQLPILVRLLYFFFIGLPLGLAVALVGWGLCVTVILMPFGIWVLHRLPLITTLTMPHEEYMPIAKASDFRVERETDSVPFLFRLVWFVLVGCWLSFIWIKLAFLLGATFILTPVGFWMINRVPAILTLEGV